MDKLPIYKLTAIFTDGKSIFRAHSRNKVLERLEEIKKADDLVQAEITNGQSSMKIYTGRRLK